MKYAIIVWTTSDDVEPGNGVVYGWYDVLATALMRATNLTESGAFFKATVVKVV